MKLVDYIRGHRKGKEACRLEKESMKDSFLADAMDGYQQVEGNHESRIELLRQQISTRSSKKRNMYAIIGSIAACLVIGFGISFYFLFLKNDVMEKPSLAKENTIIPKDTSTTTQAIAQVPIPSAETKKTEPEKIKNAIENPIETTLHKLRITPTSGNDNTIRGKLTDETGAPIIGANIFIKGTNVGVVTDINGEFTLIKVNGHNELTANYIGYQSIDIPIDTCRNLLIAMNQDKQVLEEVVVTGHGAQKKMTSTGAVIKISQPLNKEKLHAPDPVIGKRKYRKYLRDNLIRPTDEKCRTVKGKVTLSFFVDKKGNPQRIVVIKSLCTSADKEAIRLIKEGPKWTPSIVPVEIKVKF